MSALFGTKRGWRGRGFSGERLVGLSGYDGTMKSPARRDEMPHWMGRPPINFSVTCLRWMPFCGTSTRSRELHWR